MNSEAWRQRKPYRLVVSANGPCLDAIDRRTALKLFAAMPLICALDPAVGFPERAPSMSIACFIRYQIDPFQLDAFRSYAENWGRIIPRCGGHLIGYFLPQEGTNDIAWGLIGFPSLAAYEQYRARLREDSAARENFLIAQSKRFILREERTFLSVVDGTFELPAARTPS